MPAVPRPLSARERAILDLLLSVDFPGVDVLRKQALSASAEGEHTVVGLVIDESLPRAQMVGRTPVQAVVAVMDTTVVSSCSWMTAGCQRWSTGG